MIRNPHDTRPTLYSAFDPQKRERFWLYLGKQNIGRVVYRPCATYQRPFVLELDRKSTITRYADRSSAIEALWQEINR